MFPERLKKLRKEAGYTNQTQIAEELNISQQSYSQWESGKRRPSEPTLARLSNFFNVSIDYLLGKSDVRNPYVKSELEMLIDRLDDKQKEQIIQMIKQLLQ